MTLGGAAPALAQETITFVAATFAEAGRGDRLREWVEGFNASQDEVRVEPVADRFRPKYRPGEAVFCRGDRGDGLYLIRSGRARVQAPSEDGGHLVQVLEAPETGASGRRRSTRSPGCPPSSRSGWRSPSRWA
jgi:hypothetical protein